MPSDDDVPLGARNIPAEGAEEKKARHFRSHTADVPCRSSRSSRRAVDMYDAINIDFGIQYERLCLPV
jgi:hypothetical protein